MILGTEFDFDHDIWPRSNSAGQNCQLNFLLILELLSGQFQYLRSIGGLIKVWGKENEIKVGSKVCKVVHQSVHPFVIFIGR